MRNPGRWLLLVVVSVLVSGLVTATPASAAAPTITSFTVRPGVTLSKAVGPPTSQPLVNFSGMSAYEAVDVYFDNTDLALVSANSAGAGKVIVTVSASATPGVHYVTVVGRHSGYSAQASFTVRTDWKQYGFSPNHLGSNIYEGTISTGNASSLVESWRSAPHSYTYSTPAVVGGVVYSAFGDGSVRAFDASTGVRKWTHSIGSGIVSSPAVADGIVYVGADDHYLYALNATTGALKWRFLTGDVVRSSPTVAKGIVYFGSFDAKLYALDAATGALKWSYTSSGTIFTSPAASNGAVYFGNATGNIYSVDALTGTLNWMYATSAAVYASPLVANGRVYVGSTDHTFYALRLVGGSLAWSYASTDQIEATAAYSSGTVYFTNDGAKVFALDGASGTVRWTSTPAGANSLIQSVSVENGVLVVGDYQRTYLCAASYGGLITTLNGGVFYGGAAVTDGTVTVGDYIDGTLLHFTLGGALGGAPSRPSAAALRPNLTLQVQRPS